MINTICGILAFAVLAAFLGGLGYSIWENTQSISFPIIVFLILAMALAALLEEIITGRRDG
ncbi:MAG: hypothetical protein PVI15_10300 [Chromatiales bacterium]|jgi:hypothetical protein